MNTMMGSSLLALMVLALSGCEVLSARYATLQEAAADEAIERGWLPEWLPIDAIDIQETHDLDSNESWLVFRTTSGRLNLPADCVETTTPVIPERAAMRKYPGFARKARDLAASSTGPFKKCPGRLNDRWILQDRETGWNYSWFNG